MELGEVVSNLKKMASPSLAGSWDNVGLLLEPSPPHTVSKLLLTNDLTPEVMQEAVDKRTDMIVSYHPPIFAPMKRVTQGSWKERIAAGCLERRIALYSPHTSWDAVAQGVNDWLISAFEVEDVKPVEQTEETTLGRNKKLTFWTTASSAQTVASLPMVQQNPAILLSTEHVVGETGEGEASSKVCVQCPASSVPSILAALQQHSISFHNLECCDLAKVPIVGYGMGRVGKLQAPITVQAAVAAIKTHLRLTHVRLAQAADKPEVESVAVCAGSGGSVLRGVKADLYLTGEMSHHEVLDAVCKGTHVVLCDHSNTERGFLTVMQRRLTERLAQKVQVIVSETDRDPLVVV
ncbi:hypothetical protein ACOMHN_024957 [Nucella lapillus]